MQNNNISAIKTIFLHIGINFITNWKVMTEVMKFRQKNIKSRPIGRSTFTAQSLFSFLKSLLALVWLLPSCKLVWGANFFGGFTNGDESLFRGAFSLRNFLAYGSVVCRGVFCWEHLTVCLEWITQKIEK